MVGPPSTAPITAHAALGKLDPHVVASGPAIPPIERVALFSAEQWEHFTDEWAASLTDYAKVERASGAGDKGCDIVAFPVEGGAVWDNYQCKHYDKPLTPTDIWVELGKICHYSFIGEYTIPRKYRFVAPRNVGTKLASYLRKALLQSLTARKQTEMRVGKRKHRKESERRPAVGAATAMDPDPIVMLVMRLLAATSVANDRIAFTNRTEA